MQRIMQAWCDLTNQADAATIARSFGTDPSWRTHGVGSCQIALAASVLGLPLAGAAVEPLSVPVRWELEPMPPFDGLQDFVKPDVPLAPLIWFRLGGHASFFAKPRTLDDLLTVMKRARDASVPLKILGGGSNVLVRDGGVDALVIHLESPFFSDVAIVENTVTAGTAVPLTALISQTARAGLAGVTPGTERYRA